MKAKQNAYKELLFILLSLFSFPLIAQVNSTITPNPNQCCKEMYKEYPDKHYNQSLSDSLKSELDQSISLLTANNADHLSLAKCLLLRATHWCNLTKYPASNDDLLLALKMLEKVESSKEKKVIQGWIYSILGYNNDKQFDFFKAITYSTKMLDKAVELKDSAAMILEHNNRCLYHVRAGNFDQAQQDCARSGALLNTIHSIPFGEGLVNKMVNKNNLGILYLEKAEERFANFRFDECWRNYEKSIEYFKEMIALFEKYAPDHDKLPIAYGNVGMTYAHLAMKERRYRDSSEFYWKKSVGLFKSKSLTPERKMYLGQLQIQAGAVIDDLELAMKEIDEGLRNIGYYKTRSIKEKWKVIEQIPQRILVVLGFNSKGKLMMKKYKQSHDLEDLKKSLEYFHESLEWLHYISLTQLSSSSIMDSRRKLDKMFSNATHASLLLFEKTGDQKFFNEAFYFAEQLKSFILRQGIRSRYLSTSGDLTQKTFYERELELTRRYQALQRDLANARNAKTGKEKEILESILKVLEEKYILLNELSNSSKPEDLALFFDRFNNENPDVKTIQEEMLSKETAIIEYASIGMEMVALIITKGKVDYVKITPTADFWKHFDMLKKYLSTDASPSKYKKSAYPVYQTLFEKVKSKLPKEIKELLIVPYYDLHSIPFEALLAEMPKGKVEFSDFPFLLNEYDIGYIHSAGTLAWIEKLREAKKSLPQKRMGAFTASPDRSAEGWKRGCGSRPLDSLRFITQKVVEKLGDEKALLFDQARKSDFMTNHNVFEILHFAMHGCTEADNPLDYYLQFMEEADHPKPFLTVYDIYQLRLNAKLVVLGSCNTKQGKLEAGEGIASITRTFTLAGCENLIGTLQEVPDYSASKILDVFYEALLEKEANSIQALTLAKKNYLDDPSVPKDEKSPAFWSNIISIGKPQLFNP